jgi:hypothetical protein
MRLGAPKVPEVEFLAPVIQTLKKDRTCCGVSVMGE